VQNADILKASIAHYIKNALIITLVSLRSYQKSKRLPRLFNPIKSEKNLCEFGRVILEPEACQYCPLKKVYEVTPQGWKIRK
jgi:hypothetical protein